MRTDIKKENSCRHFVIRMRKDTEGSLAIEAALVLPVFVFMMVCVMSLVSLLLFQLNLKTVMHEEMQILALENYKEPFPDEGVLGQEVLSKMNGTILKLAPIEGNAEGISFSEVGSNDEILRLQATYRAKLYYDFFSLFQYSFIQEEVFHNWKGYKEGLYSCSEEWEEEYVYITESGEVYHRNRNCSHIKLTIKKINKEDLTAARNMDGGKYRSCEYCHSKPTDSSLYITTSGDRYHNTLGCSGLKRTVMAIPISEVGSRRPCSRCGGTR